ncbi:MAG: RadC family protein [Clostridia bacterium]|nr:RadC family protein [Clostridia bacterium]
MAPEKDKKINNAGHRSRCKKRLLSEGANTLSDVELLEMLLFYAVPRADTKSIAEDLIEKYGTLSGVIRADLEEIAAIPHLKDSARVLFSLLSETIARTAVCVGDKGLLEGERLKEYLLELYRERVNETVYALYFAAEGEFIGQQVVFHGGISSAKFSLRTITEGIIRIGGKTVILAHNHPSGILVPSSDDIISTKRIAAHLAANEIELLEHYIVGKDDVVGILHPNR